jgi:hypothetical protein
MKLVPPVIPTSLKQPDRCSRGNRGYPQRMSRKSP